MDFATATYSKTTNSLSVAYDGNRLILNDLELQQQLPDAADYPASPATSPTKPFHMLGPSFVSGGQQVFEFVRMVAHSSWPTPAALGNLGGDILSKKRANLEARAPHLPSDTKKRTFRSWLF